MSSNRGECSTTLVCVALERVFQSFKSSAWSGTDLALLIHARKKLFLLTRTVNEAIPCKSRLQFYFETKIQHQATCRTVITSVSKK